MPSPSPFDLANTDTWQRWRDQRLAAYPTAVEQLRIEVSDASRLTATEIQALTGQCRRSNMAIYVSARAPEPEPARVRDIARQLGLQSLDHNLCAEDSGIACLQVSDKGRPNEYIPYTNKPLSWHTDGYYNPPAQRIRAFILHCVQPAATGGENLLADPEMIYLQLRERDPELVRALMDPQAMTIPANLENGREIRPRQPGPVFSIDPVTGDLHMRYTARTRSIEWHNTDATRAAVSALREYLSEDSPYVFRYRLQAGEGLVCNNVLHTRTAFSDEPAGTAPRLMYRGRYNERIMNTTLSSNWSKQSC